MRNDHPETYAKRQMLITLPAPVLWAFTSANTDRDLPRHAHDSPCMGPVKRKVTRTTSFFVRKLRPRFMGGVFTAVDPRGACHLDANRVTTLYSVDPKMDPKTMMQPCASAAKAPGWRVHSHFRHGSHGSRRITTTSDCRRRCLRRSRQTPKLFLAPTYLLP